MGIRIALLRKSIGMSQAELANELHISPSTLGSYEQGRREPSCAMLVSLSKVFHVSVDYLLTGHIDCADDINESIADNHVIIKVGKQLTIIQLSKDIGMPLIEFLQGE